MTSETIIITVELFILMLSVAVVVGVSARKLRLPYTVGLVLIGSLLLVTVNLLRDVEGLPFIATLLELLDTVVQLEDEVTREIILGLLVPPLIFEAAFHLRWNDLQRDLRPILLFAIPGVIITTLLVGWAVTVGTDIPFASAAVFGALIAATDPVAVVALFRSMGVPKRLQVLLEGESLLNDGTAIVIFGLALSIARGRETFTLPTAVLDFVLVAGGGLIIGLATGWVISRVINRLDDHLIETALTFILAYGAYFLAESVHVSGVLAVVAAGMLNGNIGPRAMSPTTRIVVGNFWEFTAFIANSLVFLLIGLVVQPLVLWQNRGSILLAIAAVLVARGLVIYGFSALDRTIPRRWRVVLHWGGLRGAISLALALGLGANSELRAMAFGVVVFTLLVQGTTMGPLVGRLQLGRRSPARQAYNLQQARAIGNQSAYQRLESMHRAGLISDTSWEIVRPVLEEQASALKGRMRSVLQDDPSVAQEELDTAWREVLRVERSTLNSLFADGLIDEHAYEELVAEIDAALANDQILWEALEDLEYGLAIRAEEETGVESGD